MNIRAMKIEDVPGVMIVELESFTVPWSADAFEHEIRNNPFAYYFVLEQEGMICGYAGMWLIIDEAHVTNIAVSQAYRGQKWGEKLLNQLIELAEKNGAIRMTLEVRVSNFVAQKMYAKYGFTYQTTRPRYYSDNSEDAWVLTREGSNG